MTLLVIVLLILAVGGTGELFAESASSSSPDPGPGGDVSIDDSLDFFGGNTVSTITNDPSTWPQGDQIWNVARAIAFAEGANVAGSVPDRLNNPGDLSDGATTYGFQFQGGSNVTIFPDKQTGWQWLYDKLNNIASGNSQVYSPSMTWTQIAQKWAGNWSNRVHNVTSNLGVDPSSTFGEYVNG